MADLLGSLVVFAFVEAVEVGEIVETSMGGDLGYSAVSRGEELVCDGQAVVVQVLDEAGAHGVLEKLHKMGFAAIA